MHDVAGILALWLVGIDGRGQALSLILSGQAFFGFATLDIANTPSLLPLHLACNDATHSRIL
jgi:hypothetical protein